MSSRGRIVFKRPPPGFFFGTFMAVPMERAYAANAAEIRANLDSIRALGMTGIAQEFAGNTTAPDWLFFLDECSIRGMQLLIAFDDATQTPVWLAGPGNFDLRANGPCLSAVKGHPALFAHQLVDEPWNNRHDGGAGGGVFTTARLIILYAQAKALAPTTRLQIAWSGEIWRGELGEFPPSKQYTSALLYEVAQISALEFRVDLAGANVFQRQDLYDNQSISRRAIRRETPSALVFSSSQAFGAITPGPGGYYFPSLAEFKELTDVLISGHWPAAGALDGINFQLWNYRFEANEGFQYNLSHAVAAAHRAHVLSLTKRYGRPA